jgi:hypothetical protein
MGKRRVISTSKIKKIIAIKKKCKENGNRDEDLGSNPHSNGDLFSRSAKDFLDVILIIIIRAIIMMEIINAIKNSNFNIYTISRSFDWKSNIIFILYKLSTSSVN